MDRTLLEGSFKLYLLKQFANIPQGKISIFLKCTGLMQIHPLSFFCFGK
jgi:hypothetical protein